MEGIKKLYPDKDDFLLDFLNWGRRVEQRLNKLETKTNELLHTKEELSRTKAELLNRRKAGKQLSNFALADTKALALAETQIISLKKRLWNITIRLSEEIESIAQIELAASEQGYNPDTGETLPDWIRRTIT